MEASKKSAPHQQKSNLITRLLAFVLTLVLLLGAVALVAYRERLNFDSIKRWFSYRDMELSDNGQAESFPFSTSASDRFAPLGSDLLVCSPTGIRLYSGSGTLLSEQTILMDHPSIFYTGARAVVYDAGGQSLLLFSGREEPFSLTQPERQSLLAASVNADGWLAVVSEASGYKGAVSVYNPDHEAVMLLNLSSRFVMDAVVSPDNRSVAVLTIGLSESGSFESRVDLYRLDGGSGEATPQWTCPVGSSTVLALRWNSAGIWALGESAVSLVSADGVLNGCYDYTGQYLKDFSLYGDDCAVLLLGRYRASSSADLTVTAPDGSVRAHLPMEEQVLSLSAAGRYVAVLTADRLDIYDQTLSLYATLEGTQSARQVLMRSDGSALLIGAGMARLYVP